MKKIATLALIAAAALSQAQVTSSTTFITPPAFQETFDSITTGTYAGLPVFTSPAVATQIGTGTGLVVRPWPGVPTTPNMMYGDGVDVSIRTLIPMKRFGGFF